MILFGDRFRARVLNDIYLLLFFLFFFCYTHKRFDDNYSKITAFYSGSTPLVLYPSRIIVRQNAPGL